MSRILKLLLIVLCAVLSPTVADAARPPGAPPGFDGGPIERGLSNPLVVRVQKALAEAGYYKGQIDGIAGPETIKAIETYQRRQNQPVDGVVSEALAAHMETSVNVRSLLNQLHKKRLANIRAARTALMAQPETRDILTGEKNEKADPSRDPSECFGTPDPECLLAEAVESAKAIYKRQLRDWAFGEILSAQAKAGLIEAAMGSVGRIGDARLIMVALRDIAEVQAAGGRPAEALAAADIIPDPVKQSEALAAIAAIQATGGDVDGAAATARRILAGLERIDDPLKRIALRLRVVAVLSKAGDETAAQAEMLKAREAAAAGTAEFSAAAFRHVAAALAEMARPDEALDVIGDLPEASEHTPVLVSAATAQAEAGDLEHAVSTAETIQVERYRAVVLARIAIVQSQSGNAAEARDTIDKAIASSEKIKLTFARAYADFLISGALTEIGRLGDGEAFATAIELAGRVSDGKLRAHRLWSIAAAQRAVGDDTGADDTEVLAERATGEVKSSLTLVWMFADIAEERIGDGDADAAWKAFNRALGIASGISNPWARSRALARLASTHVNLSQTVEPLADKN